MSPDFNFSAMEKKHVTEVLRFWKSIDGVYLHEDGEDSEEGILAVLDRNPGYSFIARNDNDKIIAALMCGHDGRRGLIYHLGVDNNYRRRGIARHLLKLSIDKLHEAKIKKVLLFVLKDRNEARNFYEYNNWNKEEIVFVYSKRI
jgi:N-acetylglutamate synthase